MKFVPSFILTLAFSCLSQAATIVLNYSNDHAPGFELKDLSGTPLTPGKEAVSQDGAILEVGYYSLATTDNPFGGEWVTMVGPSILSPAYATIGDKTGDIPGLFGRDAAFGTKPLGPYNFPAIGTPMTIRFFDSTSYDTATYYNAVSSASWIWLGQSDAGTVLDMDLTTASLLWLGGIDSAFRTTIVIPEPGIGLTAACAIATLLARRRRG